MRAELPLIESMQAHYNEHYKNKEDLIVLLDESELLEVIETQLQFNSHKLTRLSKDPHFRKYKLTFNTNSK